MKISKSKSSFSINTKIKSVKIREFKIWDIIWGSNFKNSNK